MPDNPSFLSITTVSIPRFSLPHHLYSLGDNGCHCPRPLFPAFYQHRQDNGAQGRDGQDVDKRIPPIEKVTIYSRTMPEDRSSIMADFENPLSPDYDDDPVRWAQLAFPPNKRSWRVEAEEDCSDWFKAEVSNVVLTAWTDYLAILQASQAKAFLDSSSSETVDVSYTLIHLKRKVPVVIGEWKKNLMQPLEWMGSRLSNAHSKSSPRSCEGK